MQNTNVIIDFGKNNQVKLDLILDKSNKYLINGVVTLELLLIKANKFDVDLKDAMVEFAALKKFLDLMKRYTYTYEKNVSDFYDFYQCSQFNRWFGDNRRYIRELKDTDIEVGWSVNIMELDEFIRLLDKLQSRGKILSYKIVKATVKNPGPLANVKMTFGNKNIWIQLNTIEEYYEWELNDIFWDVNLDDIMFSFNTDPFLFDYELNDVLQEVYHDVKNVVSLEWDATEPKNLHSTLM